MVKVARWKVRCFYGRRATRGYPGQLAIETGHTAEHSRDCEVEAALARRDIGKVEVRDLHDVEAGWRTIFDETVLDPLRALIERRKQRDDEAIALAQRLFN